MNAVTARPIGSFDAAAALLRERTGLVFSEARRRSFEAGVTAAMKRARLRDLETYLARLAHEPGLLDDLVAEVTVGETYFFREPRQWDVIRHDVLPELQARHGPGHRLRLWSAGCASGEEPYTMAIVAREIGLEQLVHITATDISRAALARAARARYTRWSLRGAPEEAVRAHFHPVGDAFEVSPEVRAAVEFGYLNLAEDAYPSLSTGIWGMDLVLCRNVLIYFDRDTVVRVARRLVGSLAAGGWLLLGASDPLLSDLVPCEVAVTPAGLAYRRAVAHLPTVAVPAPAPSPRGAVETDRLPHSPPSEPPPAAGEPTYLLAPAPADDLGDAERFYGARDYERAAEVAARAVAREGGSAPALWILLVRSLANRGDLKAAGGACAAALERHRDSAELLYLHAVLLAEAGLFAQAARAARGALYLDRHLVIAHVALGSVLARAGDRAGAQRALHNADRLLGALAPEAEVPASDGERADRLAEMVRMQIKLLVERDA